MTLHRVCSTLSRVLHTLCSTLSLREREGAPRGQHATPAYLLALGAECVRTLLAAAGAANRDSGLLLLAVLRTLCDHILHFARHQVRKHRSEARAAVRVPRAGRPHFAAPPTVRVSSRPERSERGRPSRPFGLLLVAGAFESQRSRSECVYPRSYCERTGTAYSRGRARYGV